VIFFDDDNLAMKDMAETLLSAIEYSKADIVTSAMIHFHNNEDVFDPDTRHVDQWGFVPNSPIIGLIRNCFGDAASIYRTALLKKVGGFHEQYGVTHEDWELHLRCCLAGARHAYLPDPVFWYRGTPASMSKTTDSYLNDQRQISALRTALPPRCGLLADLLFGMEKRAEKPMEKPAGLSPEQEDMRAVNQLKRISTLLRHSGISTTA
jgi:GT2 family glycosyltransferase